MSEPYRLTPMHHSHLEHRARMSVRDGWMQVLNYEDPEAEINAGRYAVGIQDATPLSKIDIQGKDCGTILRDLGFEVPEPGRCAPLIHEHSIPSYVARITSDRCMVFTSPEKREQLYQRLLEATRPGHCAHVTDVTSVYAAVHLIGPETTQLLKELGTAPVDNIGVNGCVQTPTCRVWSLLIRRQALQGSAWLVLVSRDYGAYVWDSIIAAGRKHQIQPFGASAAKVLTGMGAFDVAIV